MESKPSTTTPAPSSPTYIDPRKGGSHSVIAVVLLIFMYPIGVFYVLSFTNWPKWLKILLTIPILLGIMVFIGYTMLLIFR